MKLLLKWTHAALRVIFLWANVHRTECSLTIFISFEGVKIAGIFKTVVKAQSEPV